MPPDTPVPSSPDSERELLASCVVDPSTVWALSSETDPGSFTGILRPRLREMLLDLIPRHAAVSYALLEAEWARLDLPAAGLAEIDMLRRCSGMQDWSYHLDRVRSCGLRREILRRAEMVTRAAGNGEGDDEVLSELSALSSVGTSHASRRNLVRLGPDIDPEIRSRRWAASGGTVDLRMGGNFEGIGPGEVFVLLARSYVGKSLWASQAAINSHALTLIVSLEMTGAAWRIRMLQQALRLQRHAVIDGVAYGRWQPQEAKTIAELDARISLADSCDGSFPSLQAALNRHAAMRGHPPSLLVIDHLSYIRPSGRFSSLHERASAASTELHQFARRNNLAILLLVQVGRAEGSDGSTEVGLQSARDSGRIEEDADYLVGLWRPSMRKGLTEERRAELEGQIRGRLCKHRNGIAHGWNFHQDPTLWIRPEEAT